MITNGQDSDRFGNKDNQYPSFIVDNAYNLWYNRWGDVDYTSMPTSNVLDEIIHCVFGQHTNINDEYTYTFPDVDWSGNDTSSASKNILLFAGRTKSKGMRIYICKLYDGNAMIGNFVPCVRKSDSKPGMYDTVSKTFYTNAGTGEFIVPTQTA